jgi:hypothetical protein
MFEPKYKDNDEYHKKMKIMMVQDNVVEDREATMGRFLNGLNHEIVNIMELQHYVELMDMVNLTTKVKRQRKRRGSSKPNQLLGSLSP